MKKIICLIFCLILILFFLKSNIYAEEIIDGEAIIKTYKNVKTIQEGKKLLVTVEVSAIPQLTEPGVFKNCRECRYINAMIINQNGYNLGLSSLLKIVDENQYQDGKWRGFIVVKIKIK